MFQEWKNLFFWTGKHHCNYFFYLISVVFWYFSLAHSSNCPYSSKFFEQCLDGNHIDVEKNKGLHDWEEIWEPSLLCFSLIVVYLEHSTFEIMCFLLGSTQESGDLVWEYNIGNPITASACVDEHLQLVPETSISSDRYEK